MTTRIHPNSVLILRSHSTGPYRNRLSHVALQRTCNMSIPTAMGSIAGSPMVLASRSPAR